MKTFLILFILILSIQVKSQNKINERTIQNFYISCKAQKYNAFNLLNTGIQLLDTKQFERSLNKFSKSLEIDSMLCDSWYLIGFTQQQLGNYKESINSCNKSLLLKPDNVSAYIIQAYSYIYLNDTINALNNFERAKQIDPNIVDSYYGIALIKYWQKDFKSSLNEINIFMSRDEIKTKKKDIKILDELKDKLQ